MNKSEKETFENGLNQHGYAFASAVINEAADLFDKRSSAWQIHCTEQPVTCGAHHTRIDFVLSQQRDDTCWLLVGECKRVNPVYSKWCFARSRYQEPRWLEQKIIAECIQLREPRRSSIVNSPNYDRIFDIGFVLKTSKDNNEIVEHAVSKDNDAIENSCTQVLRGLNGLVSGLSENESLRTTLQGINRVLVLPVVFTTAKLVSSDVDMAKADLNSGRVKLEKEPEIKDWLFLQYPQSPTVRHQLPARVPNSARTWSEVVAHEFWRTVTIISPNGIASYLKRRPPGWEESGTAPLTHKET